MFKTVKSVWNPIICKFGFQTPYVSENWTKVKFSNTFFWKKCLKSELFGNQTVIECLKSILFWISVLTVFFYIIFTVYLIDQAKTSKIWRVISSPWTFYFSKLNNSLICSFVNLTLQQYRFVIMNKYQNFRNIGIVF